MKMRVVERKAARACYERERERERERGEGRVKGERREKLASRRRQSAGEIKCENSHGETIRWHVRGKCDYIRNQIL